MSKKFKYQEEENEKELHRCLNSMTGVYRKSIPDIIKRHENIHKFLVTSPLSIRGASIGNCKLATIPILLFLWLGWWVGRWRSRK